MKKSLIINISVLAILVLGACRPEFGELGEPFDRTSGLSGTWSLVSVTQIDEKAVNKGYPSFVQSISLKDRAGLNDYQLILNQDEEGNPTTFEENAANSPAIIGISSGQWSVDNPSVPETITFSGGASDNYQITIGTYLGLNEGGLSLRFTRVVDGDPIVSYEYTFEK